MATRYQNLKQWNHWLAASPDGGHMLLHEEAKELSAILSQQMLAKYAALIGVPAQKMLLQQSNGLYQVLIGALSHRHDETVYIEADYQELPIFSGQVDLVILPHTLEWVEHPRQLLAEACRIVKPEGLIVIIGFNPHSLFKCTQLWKKKSGIPWSAAFLSMHELTNWVKLAGFHIEQLSSFLYRPLTKHSYFFDRLPIFEWIGKHVFPYYGGLYMLVARAKEIPLTPIKMQWKQQLTGARISSAMSGRTIHDEIT